MPDESFLHSDFPYTLLIYEDARISNRLCLSDSVERTYKCFVFSDALYGKAVEDDA